jgi:preprotein translocase subunit SecD
VVRRLALTLVAFCIVVFGVLAANIVAGNRPALGLDLQGGASVTLTPVGDYDAAAIDVAVEIIRARVDSIGVAEPEIIRQDDTVVVNLPGVEDQDRALQIVGAQGQVLLRPVIQSGLPNDATTEGDQPVDGDQSIDDGSTPTTIEPAPSTGPGESRRRASSTETTVAAPTEAEPTDTESTGDGTTGDATTEPVVGESPISDDPTDPNAYAQLPGADGLVYLVGPAGATGDVFENDAVAEVVNGQWVVVVSLRDGAAGEDQWNALTTQCFNRAETCPTGQIAIALDGTVISAPVVQEAVFTGGSVQITGDFTQQQAEDLAKVLEFGAVPVEFEVASVQTVSPTLGADSLRAALISGLIGVAFVLVFFFLYYRLLPIVLVIGLVVSSAVLWSVISLLSKTNGLALTLAGIAGIIVSIGVTVDSYVVFFEKLKDEVHAGRSMRGAAQRSFSAAFRTILVADTASFIGAIVLWYLTVGAVRGFAFFLGLSVLIDVLIAYFWTRPAVLLLARTKLFNGRRVLGLSTSEGSAS